MTKFHPCRHGGRRMLGVEARNRGEGQLVAEAAALAHLGKSVRAPGDKDQFPSFDALLHVIPPDEDHLGSHNAVLVDKSVSCLEQLHDGRIVERCGPVFVQIFAPRPTAKGRNHSIAANERVGSRETP